MAEADSGIFEMHDIEFLLLKKCENLAGAEKVPIARGDDVDVCTQGSQRSGQTSGVVADTAFSRKTRADCQRHFHNWTSLRPLGWEPLLGVF